MNKSIPVFLQGEAMNAIRTTMSLFLLVLIMLSVLGWVWAGGQPSPKMEGSRVALALCFLAGVGGLVVLWRGRPASTEDVPA